MLCSTSSYTDVPTVMIENMLSLQKKYKSLTVLFLVVLLSIGGTFIAYEHKLCSTHIKQTHHENSKINLVQKGVENQNCSRNFAGNILLSRQTTPNTLKETMPQPQHPIVLYNRVPKCGSSTMNWVIQQQEKKLKFKMLQINLPRIKISLDDTAQAEIALYIGALQKNTFVIRHLHFIDFNKFKSASPWPVYVNVIRDPVERFISFYYFIRNGFEHDKGKKTKEEKSNLTDDKINTSLDDCMKQDPNECVQSTCKTFLAYFCGNEEKCRDRTLDYALQKAKTNVEKHYLAVGITEDIENTLRLFGALLPSYFSGAETLDLSEVSTRFKTFKRPEVRETTRKLLADVLHYEIQFYDFIKKRFYQQIEDLKIH